MTSSALSGTDRRVQILRQLGRDGFVSVKSITRQFGVSDMTVRRDLRQLQAEGAVHIVHGGASLPNGVDFRARGQSEPKAKASIGRYAAAMIEPGTAVLLDAGTTILEIARALPDDFGGYVITHSVSVLNHLMEKPGVHVFSPGGDLRAESQALIGPTTVEGLSAIQADIGFLGAASVSPRGLFVAKDLERGTKLQFIRSAHKVVLCADHTKFSTISPVLLAPLDVLDLVVTDRPLDEAMAQAMADAHVEVRVVG
jgi:DeoR/GlpR family transcriptional regulator of sugar metabolism